MKTELFTQPITEDDLRKVAEMILGGQIIAFPTETVYGLGANMFDEEAIKNLFLLKNRPQNKPFIIHISQLNQVEKIAEDIPESFYRLAENFFPGPLTVVLKKKKEISSIISNDDTIAIRMPAHSITLKLIDCVHAPIVGTSANFSGEKSPTNVQDVISKFEGKIAAIIDGGKCYLFGIPSTVVSLVDEFPKILREGYIPLSDIEKILQK